MTPKQRKAAIWAIFHLAIILLAIGFLLATNWAYTWLVLVCAVAYGIAIATMRLWKQSKINKSP